MALEGIGKLLLIVGLLLAALGLVLLFAGRLPFLGKLPGDIILRKGSSSLYFPVVTFLIISAGLTLLLNLVLWPFRGRAEMK